MGVTFEMLLPNDDEGHSLGTYEADCLPRKGDLIYVLGKEVTGKSDDCGTPLECVIEDVVWEAFVSDDHKDNRFLGPRVYLSARGLPPTVYCTCTDEEREGIRSRSKEGCEDLDGLCFDCGRVRPTSSRRSA